MEFQLVTNLSRETFDRFVASHASGSFLQSWDWGEWMLNQGKPPVRVGVINSAGEVLMAAQIFLTPVPKIGGQYLYIPYGPLLAESAPEEVTNLFFTEISKQFSKSLFLRIEPKQPLAVAGKPTAHIQPGKTLALDLTKTEDELLADMHQKTRYNIKVAQRHEVKVKIVDAAGDTDSNRGQKAALKLISETSARQGYKSHPLNYYGKMVDFFGGHGGGNTDSLSLKIYSAEYNGQVLASAVMMDFGGTRTYLFGGTSSAERNIMAPYLLHWQAIQDAKRAGIKTYDFWGIETASGKTPGFVRFKLGWGGKQIQYPTPQDIVYKPLQYSGYKLLRALNRKLS